MTEEPKCKQGYEHSWFFLGVEDNGEKVYRCGNCLVRKYEAPNGTVRYEMPEA